MLPYDFFKIVHISSIILFLSAVGIGIYAKNVSKINKVVVGLLSLVILLSGLYLAKTLELLSKDFFPSWLKFKVFIWLTLSGIAPIFMKRKKRFAMISFSIVSFLVLLGVFLAVSKIDI